MILDILHAIPGWTWEYVEDFITVPRVNKMIEYWRDNCPPACRSLAASIGFKPKQIPSKISQEDNERVAEELMKMFPMRPPGSAPPVGAKNV